MMRIKHFIVPFILILPILLQAQSYDLRKPDTVWKLPASLHEISGLCFTLKDSQILAVQDERGDVFSLDPLTGQLINTWSLAGKGDFEGIEVVDSTLFLLHSSGKLYCSAWNDGPEGELKIVQLAGSKGIDLEGLGWDPIIRKLLIAVKDDPSNPELGKKGWYVFEPTTGILESNVQGVDKENFERIVRKHLDRKGKKKIMHWLNKNPDQFLLGPSAIAFHPITHEIFVLSHRGKVLLRFDGNGICLMVYPLDQNILPQPEGIAFNQKGDLYIASEGNKKKPGQIAIFHYK